jgi:hypothetical protein
MSLELSGMAAGTMQVTANGTIEASPHGAGKLRVMSQVDEVGKYEATGDLKPKAEEGKEPTDFKEAVKGAKSFVVTDMHGDADEAATKALPENVKKEQEAEQSKGESDEQRQKRMLSAMGASILTLPDLPEVGLKEGQEIKVPTKEEKRNLGGRELPVEVDSTYHLTKIDRATGSRIATIAFKREGSGADEMESSQGGSMFVAYEEETEGTLVFDLDAGLPVSVKVEQATAISFGDNAAEQYLTLEASYKKL